MSSLVTRHMPTALTALGEANGSLSAARPAAAGPALETAPLARPRFLPASTWARWALALLLAFTLLRGGMWAVEQPYFWAPDEDYHFLYVEHLTTQGSLPSPDKPLYPREYPLVIQAMKYDQYSAGPRQDFSGDPKASVGAWRASPTRTASRATSAAA